MRTCLRLAIGLALAVLASAIVLAAAPPAARHDAFACAGAPSAFGDWCRPPG